MLTYFDAQAFSPDDRTLVFSSDRTGRFEHYCVDLETGRTVQLTEQRSGELDVRYRVRPCMRPGGREVFYPDGQQLWAVDIETGRDRLVAENTKADWTCVQPNPAFAQGGRRVVCTYWHRDGRWGICHVDAEGGTFESLLCWPNPAEWMRHLTGAWGERFLCGFKVEPDCQDLPRAPRAQRACRWVLDVEAGEVWPAVVAPPGRRATHSYWGPDDRIYYHCKTVPEFVPVAVESVDLRGGDRRRHFASDRRKLGHSCVSPDGRRMVCDVQNRLEDNELYLVDLASGASEVLCWPNARHTDNITGHVHPSFSQTGQRVGFTSDAHGKAAVYVVPLDA
jgi:Tol biopolymer transport system component